jgi:hypothetical protein
MWSARCDPLQQLDRDRQRLLVDVEVAAVVRGGQGGSDNGHLAQLRADYKLLHAPLGGFVLGVLKMSTNAARGGPDDSANAEARITALAAERDGLAESMPRILNERDAPDRYRVDDLHQRAQALLGGL